MTIQSTATQSLTLSQALDIASKAYQAGKLAAAEQICWQIIAADPDSVGALNLLSVTHAALGKHEEALAGYDRALALRPDSADVLNNRGVTLLSLMRYDEALASCDRALGLRPDFVEALNNRGIALYALKRFDEALASYDWALSLRPGYIDALSNRGNALNALQRHHEALASYDRALALQPRHVDALYNRGSVLRKLERYDEAVASYDGALAFQPEHIGALTNRGMALHDLRRYDEAVASYDRALALRPDDAEALLNRGAALHDLERYEEALAAHDRALLAQPDGAAALNNRGVTLHRLRRLDEALASYDRALASRPDYAEALVNRGITLHALKRLDEAPASYNRALRLRPDYADAHFFGAMSRLLTGDFGRGWIDYEWRWNSETIKLRKHDFQQPLWLGEHDIAGKTILLHGEQGFGDTLQFCRYVPLVAARGARVIVEVDGPLSDLMRCLDGAAGIVARGSPLPDFDYHCPLLSLPLAFKTSLETIPSGLPYLRAPDQALQDWGARLGKHHRPRIGLAWSGNAGHTSDRQRSIALRALLPLLDIDATFVSLQKEVRAADMETLGECGDLLHFGDELGDFADTAALVSHLDLVISVDTGVAHLAGASGKPVWILLAYVPDWRWLLDRDDSPWYPTARLFRQSDTREWDSVIATVGEALLKLVGKKSYRSEIFANGASRWPIAESAIDERLDL
jgi:tetratricopeptide (TPR) repeat protein